MRFSVLFLIYRFGAVSVRRPRRPVNSLKNRLYSIKLRCEAGESGICRKIRHLGKETAETIDYTGAQRKTDCVRPCP